MKQLDSIPAVGFGLWKVAQQDCADIVYAAIKAGYRHLDCAADYGNEADVGVGIARALKDGLCQREELWVTSKLWNTDHAAEHVRSGFDKSRNDLQLDYLDLYLVHFPIALQHVPHSQRYPAEWLFDPAQPELGMQRAAVPLAETWAAMEALADSGDARNIGVCNYNSGLLQDLLNYARIKPAMLQIEAHPYLNQSKLIRLCQDHGIPVTAFSPLGALSYVELDMAGKSESVLQEPAVIAAAEALGRTPAQIVLRWGIQRGTAIIPKTSKPKRMVENISLFDFELADDQMTAIDGLNRNRRFNDPGVFCDAAFGTFFPIYD